jgi:hypothetical protein
VSVDVVRVESPAQAEPQARACASVATLELDIEAQATHEYLQRAQLPAHRAQGATVQRQRIGAATPDGSCERTDGDARRQERCKQARGKLDDQREGKSRQTGSDQQPTEPGAAWSVRGAQPAFLRITLAFTIPD